MNAIIPNTNKPLFHRHPESYDGNPTAVYVLRKYWDEMAESAHWNEETQEQYEDYFDNDILPHFAAKPIEAFDSPAAYEEIIAEIQKSRIRKRGVKSAYSESTLQKFRYLLRLVLEYAVKKEDLCINVLWGTNFSVPSNVDPDREREAVRTILHKSLLPIEEMKLEQEVFQNPLQSGEAMFALLAWALGSRPQETGAILWSALKPINLQAYSIPDEENTNENMGDDGNQALQDKLPEDPQYAIALYATVYGKFYKPGGKTVSMYRYIPISPRLSKFLLERRKAVEKAFHEREVAGTLPKNITSVDEMPICCAGDDFFNHCNLQKARNNCRDLLRRIGVKEAIFRFYEREAAMSQDFSIWGDEKSVTSYLLRRNFITLCYCLGLSEDEILYLAGHSMKHMVRERSDFRYTPFMQALSAKLAFRPIFNELPDWDAVAFVPAEKPRTKTVRNVPQRNVRVGCHPNGGKLAIEITPNEAGDPIRIDLGVLSKDSKPIVISGEYVTTEAQGEQRQNVNVLADLHRIYKTSASRFHSKSGKGHDTSAKPSEEGEEE